MRKSLVLNIILLVLTFVGNAVLPVHAGISLRVLTFNIRIISDSDGKNNWYYRCNDVVAFCRDIHPDVIGMQEATVPQRKFVMDCLSEYECIGQGRDGGQNGEHCPVFYRKDRFILEKSGTFWLSETPDRVSVGWDAAARRIVCWTILRDRQSGERLLFANTHFDHKGETARTQSSLLAKKRLTEYAQGLPIIVTGDFNASPQSECYAYMLSSPGTVPLGDAWNEARTRIGPVGTYHGWAKVASSESSRGDFIFTSHDINVLRFVNDDYTRRPRMLSDHNPLYTDIELP
ncbi:MAG: endonuclease/exonuclease/phosphatase family protein [Bacteroidaceae bacterium]|nr:endonuclease/exonuclease/phosphatase family protein [Bacteroidaceae bacterium]